MPLDLIGAGFGRTGTLSLKHALELVGDGPCYHMTEVMGNPATADHVAQWTRAARGERVDWSALFADYRATVDWPGCSFWRELHRERPGARVLLTKREPDRWYDSIMKTIWPSSRGLVHLDGGPLKDFGTMIHALIWDGTFDGRIEDRAHAISIFERHNAAVEATVPKDQLLIYEPGEGWERLCDFIGVPVPDAEFPHMNSSEDFGKQMEESMKLGREGA